jgi:hypothetical protein
LNASRRFVGRADTGAVDGVTDASAPLPLPRSLMLRELDTADKLGGNAADAASASPSLSRASREGCADEGRCDAALSMPL